MCLSCLSPSLTYMMADCILSNSPAQEAPGALGVLAANPRAQQCESCDEWPKLRLSKPCPRQSWLLIQVNPQHTAPPISTKMITNWGQMGMCLMLESGNETHVKQHVSAVIAHKTPDRDTAWQAPLDMSTPHSREHRRRSRRGPCQQGGPGKTRARSWCASAWQLHRPASL